METVTTTNTQGAQLTVAVAIDMKSAAIIAVALFIAILGALTISKYL